MRDKTTKECIIRAREVSWQPCFEPDHSGRVSGSINEIEPACVCVATYDPCALSPLSYGTCGRAGQPRHEAPRLVSQVVRRLKEDMKISENE